MKKQTLIMVGLCGFMMTSMSFANPSSTSSEMVSATVIRPNSPPVKAMHLSAAELGEANQTMGAHKATNALSWQTKAISLTGFMGMVVTLAVYVHLS